MLDARGVDCADPRGLLTSQRRKAARHSGTPKYLKLKNIAFHRLCRMYTSPPGVLAWERGALIGSADDKNRSGTMIRTLGLALLAATALDVAGAQAQQTIRVGWTIPAEEAKYWMMRRPEQFPTIGKDYKIEWTQFQGTAPMVQAMAAGALDCSTQGVLSMAQGAISANLETYIVAQHVGEKAGSFSVYWAVKEDSPIKTVADLKGKSVGTNVLGSGILGPMFLHLKKHGLDPEKDVKMVETGFPASEDAIRSGRVDAGVLNQPFAARAEGKGGLRKLFSLADQQANIVHIMEVCRKEFVDKNPELAKLYVKDLTAGMSKALANRDETIKVVSEVTKAPPAVLETYLLKPNDFAREPGAAPNIAGIQAMLDIYAETGMVAKKLDASKFKHSTIVAPLK
jgi:ABC-type nitrate/sulfonate/bicarbonate transport system substrate-binding protein